MVPFRTMDRRIRLPLYALLAAAASSLLAFPATAFTKAEKQEMKSMLKGPLYLKVDAPCATGRHAFGVYKRPLVEISPDKVNTDGDRVFTASWWHADSTYWGVQVNDFVVLDEVEFEGDDAEVEIELEAPQIDASTVLLFVDIRSLDDFKAAFELAFAEQPLQDQHDDWDDEVKEAISERRLMNGMTKRQAFYITGTPERFEKKDTEEVWHLRQDKGTKIGFFRAKSGESTGLPETIRFVDGQLVDVSQTGTGDSFSLD